MTKNKIVIILFFILCALPLKTHAQASNAQKIVGTSTPAFISKPIISTVGAVEKFRSGIASASEKEKVKAGNNIFEIYFFSFLSFVFINKLVFYGLSLIIIFLILRFVWNLIF